MVAILAGCFGLAAQTGFFPGPDAPVGIRFSAHLTGSQAVPPNHSPLVATATFTLGDNSFLATDDLHPLHNVLNCWVGFPLMDIHRVFNPGTASVVFPGHHGTPASTLALEIPIYGVPGPFYSPPLSYSGLFALNDSQVAQLLSGQAYVKVMAPTASGENIPSSEIRGQILRVYSGIEGTVLASLHSPRGPRFTFGAQTSVAIFTASGRYITTVRSDLSGHFRLRLDAGMYQLVPLGFIGAPFYTHAYAMPVLVTISSGEFAPVTLNYRFPWY